MTDLIDPPDITVGVDPHPAPRVIIRVNDQVFKLTPAEARSVGKIIEMAATLAEESGTK